MPFHYFRIFLFQKYPSIHFLRPQNSPNIFTNSSKFPSHHIKSNKTPKISPNFHFTNLRFLMGEEVEMKDQERVSEWEFGLPNPDDVTPLSQPLISRELASAFSPEPYRTMIDVNRASKSTLADLRIQNQPRNFQSFDQVTEIIEDEEDVEPPRKTRPTEAVVEETDDGGDGDGGGGEEDDDRSSKRARLVWTPQMHKRFIDVVAHLGIKNAVPKTIMQLMNVEGLTRENVASHLQKYRLYLKRMQGLSNEVPSSSDADRHAIAYLEAKDPSVVF